MAPTFTRWRYFKVHRGPYGPNAIRKIDSLFSYSHIKTAQTDFCKPPSDSCKSSKEVDNKGTIQFWYNLVSTLDDVNGDNKEL